MDASSRFPRGLLAQELRERRRAVVGHRPARSALPQARAGDRSPVRSRQESVPTRLATVAASANATLPLRTTRVTPHAHFLRESKSNASEPALVHMCTSKHRVRSEPPRSRWPRHLGPGCERRLGREAWQPSQTLLAQGPTQNSIHPLPFAVDTGVQSVLCLLRSALKAAASIDVVHRPRG